MSIKPQYDTYRYTSELCELESQSIVECRLQSGEIASVLTVCAHAVPEEVSPLDGEVKYSGKLYLTVVYRDLDGKICRAEKGAEFFHKAQDERITPACFAKAVFVTDGIKTRREGSGFYVSVVVRAKIKVYGTAQMEYLSGGEGLALKKGKTEVVKILCVSGETEEEDGFEIDGAQDILLHTEKANVAQAFVANGKASLIGEVTLTVCSLKGEKVLSQERQIPFTVELPVDEWVDKMPVFAKTTVRSALLTVTPDEEKNKSKVAVSLVLYSECLLYFKEEVAIVEDVFSTERNLTVKRAKEGGRYLTNVQTVTERIGGGASLSMAFDGEFSLQAVVNPKAEIACKKTENGVEAEGFIEAETIFACDDGVKCAKLSLPFVFPLQTDSDDVEIDGSVYGLTARKSGDKIEADATLKVCVRTFKTVERSYVNGVEEGEKYEENTSAFSVYVPSEGDGLWELAKKLKCKVEDVEKSNPNLTFPIKGGERLFIYRQLSTENKVEKE